MKNRAEWLTFGVFVIAVLGALGFLLRRGVHGQSAALAVALLVILLLRVGIFAWNLRRQRQQIERNYRLAFLKIQQSRAPTSMLLSVSANQAGCPRIELIACYSLQRSPA